MTTASVTATVMPDDERNSLIVSHLTSKVGIEAVRLYFNRVVQPNNLTKFLNSKKNKIQRLLYQHRIGQSQYDVLFPPIAARVTSNDFDITLMTCLIRNTFKNATPPTTGWDALPNSADLTEEADAVRIKYYRNKFVAHHSLHQLSNAEYNKAATDLKYAISRLSNTSLDAEAENILDMKIVPSQYLESITDVIPRNIREQNTAITDTWIVQRDSYVETRAYRYVRSEVQKHNITTISGNSGSGKSAIAHGIALELEAEGYTIVPIKTVDEIRTYCDRKSKQIFVLDDPVGTVSLRAEILADFESYNQIITDTLKDSQIKVVITCRKSIMNDKRVKKSQTMICTNIVDITKSDLKLTSMEKEDIFDHYVEHVEKELLKTSKGSIINQDVDNFPLLCRLFSCNTNFHKLRETFFKDMFKHLINELEVVQSGHKIQFCCLVLCLFYNNDFDTELLGVFSDISEENKSKINQIIASSGLSTYISHQEIQSAMEGLVDVYFIQEGTHVRFLHDVIYESVAFVFGSSYPKETLKVCSSSFIREHVSILKCPDQHCILLERKHFQSLAERLFKELECGNFFDVFLCPFIKELQEQLIKCYNNKPWNEICTMLELNINSNLLVKNITKDIDYRSRKWYFLDVLSSNNTKLIHWVLAMGLQDLFTFLYTQYKHLKHKQTEHINLIPIACLSGNIELTKMILKEEDNRDILDKWDACHDVKLSTLHMAVFSNNPTMVQYIIKYTTDKNIQTKHGRTPLYVGAALGLTSICKILIDDGVNVNISSNEGRTPLYMASTNGHIDIVKILVDKVVDINMADNYGDTPFYTAIINGHIDVVKVLVDKGADINMIDEYGRTPLHTAFENGHIDMFNVLVDKGGDINMMDKYGYAPLNTASIDGHIDNVKFIVHKGADINIIDQFGDTPLFNSSLHGNIDVVKFLVDSGADVNITNNTECTPIYAASYNGHIGIVNVLVDSGADVNLANNDGWTPLFMASVKGNIDMVKVLVNSGADVNLAEINGETPLYTASVKDDIDMVKVLVDEGADVNLADNDGKTPLYTASVNGHIDIVKVLVDKGADVNMANNDGCTPLFTASIMGDIAKGDIDIIKVLVDSGADINLANYKGWTPLYTASYNGHIDMVNVLVDSGADVHIANNDGNTPLYIASVIGHIAIVNVLLDGGADVNMANNDGETPLNTASYNGQIDIVNVLVDSGADVNLANNDGWTPLYTASAKGHIDMVKILVDSGANVNLANNKGCTPLFKTSANGHLDIVKVLVDKGADMNMINNYGYTPLYIASAQGHIDVVKILVDKGADINMADKYGWTPLLIASKHGHIDIVTIFKDNCVGINKAE